MNSKLNIFSYLSSSTIIITTSINTYTKSENHLHLIKKYNNLFVFGDSLSDQGALIGATKAYGRNYSWWNDLVINHDWQKKLLWWSDGVKLKNPYYENRSFSNGKVAVEILADKLGISSKPAWTLGVNHQIQQIGTNFAVAGAKVFATNKINDYISNMFTLEKQIQSFMRQYQNNLSERDLVYINIGSNDLILNEKLNDRRIENFTSQIANNIEKNLQLIITNRNARNIIISNYTDLSKIPHFSLTKNVTYRAQVNKAVKSLNNKLKQKIQNLNTSYSEIIKLHDLNQDVEMLKQEFIKRGSDFYTTNATWMTMSKFPQLKIGIKYATSKINEKKLDQYFYMDELHPTRWVHNKVAERIYQLISPSN